MLLTELLNKEQLLCRSLTTSSCLYGKKKKSRVYENTDLEKYRDLIHTLTSCKDQAPESLSEEDDKIYRPVSKYKHLSQKVESNFPENWVPLTNPNKSILTQKTAPDVPLQISLQKNKMASVTTILQQTMPLEHTFYLERWKQQMILELGKEGFAEYTKQIFQQGKLFHTALEALLVAEDISAKVQEEDTSISGYVTSVQQVLQDVTEVRALESAVQHETLHYRGLVDCVAEYRGKLCVIDWKTSGKSKPLLQNTFDNPLQIAAYIGALNHDGNYDFQVDCGLIVVAYKDGSPAHAHYMNTELCSLYWNKWLFRLEEYNEKMKGSET